MPHSPDAAFARPVWRVMVGAVALVALLAGVVPAGAQPASEPRLRFADPAFERVWATSDAPVAAGSTSRSWLWGPAPVAAAGEPYAEGLNGRRLVQYFDKARMEFTYPTADRGQAWFVTNGLLTKELVAGQIQNGDDQFAFGDPARIPVAGDPDSPDAPSYAAFRGVATLQSDNRAADRTGQLLDQAINGGGRVRTIEPREEEDAYRFARYEPATGHNILSAFWDSMNALPGADWLFAMGYPITEPYWIKVKLGGQERDVVVQLFERRVLTYTPSNRAEWRVEMGNIGRHYYQWRYRGITPQPVVSMEPATPGLPLRVRGFNYRPGEAARVAVTRYEEGPEQADTAAATPDAAGGFEVALDWDRYVAVLYGQAGTYLEVWAGNASRQSATTPLQVGNQVTERVTGQVVDVSRGARVMRVLLDSGVIKGVTISDETAIERPDRSKGSVADIVTGARLEVAGLPGGAGVLLARVIRLRA